MNMMLARVKTVLGSLLLLLSLLFTTTTHAEQSSWVTSQLERADSLDLKDPARALIFLEASYNDNAKRLSDAERLQYYWRLANYHLYLFDNAKTLYYLDKAYALMPEVTDHAGISILLNHATILFDQGNLEGALSKAQQAENLAKTENNQELLATAYNNRAWGYATHKNDARALYYYQLAYDIIEKSGDANELAFLQAQMFHVYYNLQDIDKSIELLQLAIAHFEANNMWFDQFNSLRDLAAIERKVTPVDAQLIIKLYQQMVALSDKLADRGMIYYAYIGLTAFYTAQLDTDTALKYWRLAQGSVSQRGSDRLLASHFLTGSKLYIALKDYPQALEYFAVTEQKFVQYNLVDSIVFNIERLETKVTLAIAGNDYQSAYEDKNQVLALHKIYNTNTREQIRSKFKVQFDNKQQQLSNQLLAKNQKINQIELQNLKQAKQVQFAILMFSVCAVIVLLLLFYRQTRNTQQLNILANTDVLTQIANRRRAFSFAQQQVTKVNGDNNSALSIIVYDIDHFKKVNDTHGHSLGDHVLVNVAKISKEQLRSNDLLGRIGGEEFLAILTDTTLAQALDVAERLRVSIEATITQGQDQDISVTASFGVAQYNPQDKEFSQLFKHADELLYRAKEQGRNRIVHNDS